jgi:hypothetical protein
MPGTSLPRPPRVPVLAEPPPVVDPPLVEPPLYEGVDVDDLERLEVEVDEGPIGAEFVRTATDVAFNDQRVRELLGDERHVAIGLRAVDDKESDNSRFALVGYSYDDAMAYEVRLSGEQDRLQVVDVQLQDYQPAPADEEVELAIRLARADKRVALNLDEGFEAHALLVSGAAPLFLGVVLVVALCQFDTSQDVVAVVGAFSGVVGTVIGAFFGVQAGSAGKEATEEGRAEAE